jgi:hypothetical protein
MDLDEMVHPSGEQRQLLGKTSGPTPAEWAEIKDAFTHLYLEENRKLKDVREILSRKHGFNASEKMFKRRISEWKIRKNYKSKEKEILAGRVKACVDAGQDVQSLSFYGRPVKLDRLRRHCRKDRRLAPLWDHLSHCPDAISTAETPVKEDSRSTSATRWTTPLRGSSASSRLSGPLLDRDSAGALCQNIRPPNDLYYLQSTLFHTREAINWKFTAFTPLEMREVQIRFPDSIPEEVSAGQSDPTSAFWLALHHGFGSLEKGRAQEAWKTLDKCCRMVRPLIATVPMQLLSCILLHFATSWRVVDGLERHLLDFVASMAAEVLNPHHPLAKALRMVATEEVRELAVEAMMDLIVQGYRVRRQTRNSSLFALRVDQIDILRKRKRFDKAHALCNGLLEDSRAMRPKRQRTALAAMGRLYADQGEEFALEGVAHRILENETSDPAASNTGGTTTWACDQLATLAMGREDYQVAESYLRRATCLSYQRYLHRGPPTISFLERLEACIRCQGKKVSINTLCAELGIPMENLQA